MVAFHTPERPTTATPQPAPRHNATPSDSATAPGVPCYTIPRDVRTAKKSTAIMAGRYWWNAVYQQLAGKMGY